MFQCQVKKRTIFFQVLTQHLNFPNTKPKQNIYKNIKTETKENVNYMKKITMKFQKWDYKIQKILSKLRKRSSPR